MIARTALHPEALRDLDEIWKKLTTAGLDSPTLEAFNPHETLAKLVNDFSVIQLRGKPDTEAILEAIAGLDEESKVLWEETLIALIDCDRVTVGNDDRTTGDVLGDQNLPTSPLKDLDLAVVSRRVASLRHLPDQGFTGRTEPPELSTAVAVGKCETVRQIQELERNQHYPVGTQRSQIWNDRFAPLARVATEIWILDRFLFVNYAGKGDAGIKHVKWLLDSLSEELEATPVPVAILAEDRLPRTGWKNDADLKSKLAIWLKESQFNKKRPGLLNVYLAPWTEAELKSLGEDGQPRKGGKPHNRHIRFNTWAALTTEEGFDRFNQSKIWGEDGMSLYRVLTHPDSADDATHIPTLKKKEDAIIETSTWQWLSWSIAYDLAGGQGDNPNSYTNHTGALHLVAPTREDHKFAGWLGTDLKEATINVVIAEGSTGHRCYTATWIARQHQISESAPDGALSRSTESDETRKAGHLR